MKRKICLLLLVIQIMAIAPGVSKAQTVEERQTVIDQTKMGNIIRFTLEVERDSALCLPQTKVGECYVISQKFKKYVYVDISQTPYITPYYAQKAFESPDLWINTDTSHYGQGTSQPKDFKAMSIYKYSNFPWLQAIITKSGNSYYHYNKNHIPSRMEKDMRIEIYSEVAVQCWVLWIIILALLVAAVKSIISGNFINFFENGGIPAVLVTFSILIIVIVDFCTGVKWPLYSLACVVVYAFIAMQLPHYSEIVHQNKEPNKWFYKAGLYFLVSIASTLGLLFWSVNKFKFYYWTMPITAVLALLPILPGLIPTSIKDKFYHITGW